MITQTILYLRGLPASGKSTFAHDWVRQSSNRVRINLDDLRRMSGDYMQHLKDPYIFAAQEALIDLALLHGKDVVVDNTTFIEDSVLLTKRPGYNVIIHFLDTPIEKCIERDAVREFSVGAKVIIQMAQKAGLIDQAKYDQLIDKYL